MTDLTTKLTALADHFEKYPIQPGEYIGESSTLTPAEYRQLARCVEALNSIAKNTCCGGCQEAALVARAALKGVSS